MRSTDVAIFGHFGIVGAFPKRARRPISRSVRCLGHAKQSSKERQVEHQTIVPPAILIQRQRTLARVHKHRAKKRAGREAAKKAVKEARRVVRRAALEARRARLGLPMPGTPSNGTMGILHGTRSHHLGFHRCRGESVVRLSAQRAEPF